MERMQQGNRAMISVEFIKHIAFSTLLTFDTLVTEMELIAMLSCQGIVLCIATEWEKVWSRLSAHLQPFFSALSAYFNNFRQKILYFDVSRQKRVLFNCFATKQCLGMLKM